VGLCVGFDDYQLFAGYNHPQQNDGFIQGSLRKHTFLIRLLSLVYRMVNLNPKPGEIGGLAAETHTAATSICLLFHESSGA